MTPEWQQITLLTALITTPIALVLYSAAVVIKYRIEIWHKLNRVTDKK